MRWLPVLALILMMPPPAVADGAPNVPCRCRFFGTYFELGQTVCMRTPDGPRLARCSMMLNNTSWDISRESCPQARMTPLPAVPAYRLADFGKSDAVPLSAAAAVPDAR